MTDHSSRYSELLPMDKPLPLCLSGLGATAARARRRGNGRIKRALPWRRAKGGGKARSRRCSGSPPPRPARELSRELHPWDCANRALRADGAGRSLGGGLPFPPQKNIMVSPSARPEKPGRTNGTRKKRMLRKKSTRRHLNIKITTQLYTI